MCGTRMSKKEHQKIAKVCILLCLMAGKRQNLIEKKRQREDLGTEKVFFCVLKIFYKIFFTEIKKNPKV